MNNPENFFDDTDSQLDVHGVMHGPYPASAEHPRAAYERAIWQSYDTGAIDVTMADALSENLELEDIDGALLAGLSPAERQDYVDNFDARQATESTTYLTPYHMHTTETVRARELAQLALLNPEQLYPLDLVA